MSELAESWKSNGSRQDLQGDPRHTRRLDPEAAGPDGSLEGLQTRGLAIAKPGTTEAASRPVAGPDFGVSEAAPSEDFELHEEIGRGAMGVVYRATQKSLQRTVAVKTVAPGRDSLRALPRFEREARITGFLDHPNIIPIYDFGNDANGRAMLAMKLVEGRSWKEHLADRGEAASDLVGELRILIQVCHAASFAHARGVAHLDLKPGNVMVGRFGEVLVMDWGIAVGFREDSAVRATPKSAVNRPLGTPCYMAPELARGRGEALGPHTDIYLLGAILFELLEGRPPHIGANSGQCMTSSLENSPPAFLKPSPAELRALCRQAMAASAEDRPASVDAFREQLEGYLAHRESLLISEKAQELSERGQSALAATRVGQPPRGGRDALYADLTEAIAGFRQARLLWPENPEAVAGEQGARLAYAQAALSYGDLGLAEDQARRAAKAQGATELQAHIAEARGSRARAARASRWLRGFVAAATLVFAVGATLSYTLVRDARLESRRRQVVLDLRLLQDLERENEDLWPARPTEVMELRGWLDKARHLLSRRALHAAALARAEGAVADQASAGWERDALEELLTGPRRKPGGPWGLERLEALLIPEVERRLERALALRERADDDERARSLWRARHPDLPFQRGLIPLGPDPRSKRPEFAVAVTGEAPRRGPDGQLLIDEDSAIVLVLLPEGRFLIGASDEGPAAALALPREKPARPESVEAFFISKYEVTQGQWRRITDRNPSKYQPASDRGARYGVTARHPVEYVSWLEGQKVLESLGLELPSEVQWEYALRAGTESPWWSGSSAESLAGRENLSDLSHRDRDAQEPFESRWDDGFPVHAPVGSLAPNPFGLHDMGGNVQEWCADPYPRLSKPDAKKAPAQRVFRGGAWSRLARDARSSARFHHRPSYHSISLGLRPIRRLQ